MFWLDMPSLYTFHESKFPQVQTTKIELSKNKLPKYCFFSCCCETFCTYIVNAQSGTKVHSQVHKCTVKCTVRYTDAQ